MLINSLDSGSALRLPSNEKAASEPRTKDKALLRYKAATEGKFKGQSVFLMLDAQ
ncbi:MAG: hypothetical protein M5R37_14995 [Melioribacteraceae bacterium]|nr:hypothetical protein [Melioribacteraceae bacterium]